MTIQEIESKMERDYAGVFRTFETRICPTCNRIHRLSQLDRTIVLNVLTSAYLAGQSKGLRNP